MYYQTLVRFQGVRVHLFSLTRRGGLGPGPGPVPGSAWDRAQVHGYALAGALVYIYIYIYIYHLLSILNAEIGYGLSMMHVLIHRFLMVGGSWRVAQDSRCMAHGSRLMAHDQDKGGARRPGLGGPAS